MNKREVLHGVGCSSLHIQDVQISELKEYENNPRHNDGAVAAVAESIAEFGFKVPIVIDRDGVIVAGHTRKKAAERLGLESVPCIVADDLTPAQVAAFRLADNKTAELAEWDMEKLQEEIDALKNVEIDLSAFGFEDFDEKEEYERKKEEFRARMEAGELSEDDEEYQEFVAKFEPKKTTDDCYTPPIVYEAVADYVAERYGLSKSNFVRPFVPNGDYQAEKYKPTDVVVDNPPFSIMAEIVNFYNEHGVKFFLFAPNLTLFNLAESARIICGVSVTYENGANVNTSFITNLETCAFRSAPKLYAAVKKANEENLKQMRVELPKYTYPLNVMTAPMLAPYSRLGIDFEVAKDECYFIRALDSQKDAGKGIYGAGYLISDRKKAEREKAEREKAEREKAEREKAEREKAYVWKLSDREKDIIKKLK